MRLIRILLAMLALCSVSTSFALSQMTGQKLLELCQDSLAVLEKNAANMNMQTAANSSLCLGYLTGYEDMHYIASAIAAGAPLHYADVMKKSLYYCIPENVGLGDQVKTVVNYLTAHPKEQTKAASVLLFSIFKQSYPCK